jgi:hypothetical protein
MTAPDAPACRAPRLLRRAACSVILGIVCTLGVCLFASYRSVTAAGAAWKHIATVHAQLVRVSYAPAFAKTSISWSALNPAERQEFDRTGKDGLSGMIAGERTPPPWSSAWDHAAIAASLAQPPARSERQDIAVGWPWLAFHASRGVDSHTSPPASRWHDAHPLPNLLADVGLGYMVIEARAIPLRPIWPGLLADISCFAAASFAALSIRSARRTCFAPGRPRPRLLGRRIFSPVQVAVALAAGLVLTAIVGVGVPMVLRQRWISVWSTERSYTGGPQALLWSGRTTRMDAEDAARISPETAVMIDREILALSYTRDPDRRKTGERDGIDAGPPNMFSSRRTGWPMPILWGAQWRVGDFSPTGGSIGLVELGPLKSAIPRVVRGVDQLPTRPLWLGWIVNTVFYASLWVGLCCAVTARRRRRRWQRNRCPSCAYDLRDTPASAPCPECGERA